MPPLDLSEHVWTIVLWIVGGAVNILIVSLSTYMVISRKLAVLEARFEERSKEVEELREELRNIRSEIFQCLRRSERR